MIGKLSILIVATIIAGASSNRGGSIRRSRGGIDAAIAKAPEPVPAKKKVVAKMEMLEAYYIPVSNDVSRCPEVGSKIANLLPYQYDPFECGKKDVGVQSCICKTIKTNETIYMPFRLVCVDVKKAAMAKQGKEAKFNNLIVGDQLIRSIADYNGGNHMLIDPQVGIEPYIGSMIEMVSKMSNHMSYRLKMKFATPFFEAVARLLPKLVIQVEKEFKGLTKSQLKMCHSVFDSWSHLLEEKIDVENCLNTGNLKDEDKVAAMKCNHGDGMTPEQDCRTLYNIAKAIQDGVGLSPMATPGFCATLTLLGHDDHDDDDDDVEGIS